VSLIENRNGVSVGHGKVDSSGNDNGCNKKLCNVIEYLFSATESAAL